MSFSRRNFLKSGLLTASSVALTACQRNVEHKLVSQYQMPEYKLPGQHLYWATNCGECSGGCGVAVKTTDGRAIKMEGIPEHPLSRGRLCARGQSGLQALYHPDRLNSVLGPDGSAKNLGWDKVLSEVLNADSLKGSNPIFAVRGLKGTVGGEIVELARRTGGKIWVVDYPGRMAERQVIKALTGKAELAHYPLESADYAVMFGGDFFAQGHNSVLANWSYGEFRRGKGRDRGVLVAVNSHINQTAACADKWLPVRPGTEGWVALGVGNALAEAGKAKGWPAWAKAVSMDRVTEVTGLSANVITRLAEKLAAAKNPLVFADSDAGNYVNGVDSLYVIHALNKALRGSIDTFEPENVLGTAAVPAGMIINTEQAWAALNGANAPGAMWIFDVDLARVLPASLKPEETLAKAGKRVLFSCFGPAEEDRKLYTDVVPVLHWLESWGDQRVTGEGLEAYNIQQPAVRSQLNGPRSLGDILVAIRTKDLTGLGVLPATPAAGEPAPPSKPFDMRTVIMGKASTEAWESTVARGGSYKDAGLDWELYPNRSFTPPRPLASSAPLPAAVNPYAGVPAAQVSAWNDKAPKATGGDQKTLVPFATLALRDGSFGNRPWMQELPDPISTVVWGSWVEMNEEWAKSKGIERHDVVKVTVAGGGSFEAPAMPLPSVHPDALAIPVGDDRANYASWENLNFGMGNKVYGRYGYTNRNYGKRGVNPLKSVPATMTTGGNPQWVGAQVTVEKLNKTEMITAMDLRVFNLPREVLPFE